MSKRSTTTKATTPRTPTKRSAGRPKKAADPEVTVTQIRAKAEKPVNAPKPPRAPRPKKIADVVPPKKAVPVDLGAKRKINDVASPKTALPTNADVMNALEGLKRSLIDEAKGVHDRFDALNKKLDRGIEIFTEIKRDVSTIDRATRKKSWFSRRRG